MVLLDYFAIYKEYQNKKYGTKAIEIFKSFFQAYDGVYGEIEKNGLGKNAEENKIREKRIQFWENLGFSTLDIDLELCGVVYSPCIFKIKNFSCSNEEIMEYAFLIYVALLGEKRVQKDCRLLNSNRL